MPIEELKSTVVTAADALVAGSAGALVDLRLWGGTLKEGVATFEFAVKTVGSTYRIGRLPARGRISAINVLCDSAIDSACAIDIGLHRIVADGGAAVDADCYTTGLDLAGAGLLDTETANYKYEVLDISKVEQFIWQDGGVAADPGAIEYDLIATTSTALNTTGGTVSFIVRWVAP
jgi:hypothetical protein